MKETYKNGRRGPALDQPLAHFARPETLQKLQKLQKLQRVFQDGPEIPDRSIDLLFQAK